MPDGFDPRQMMQLGQLGVGMMGAPGNPFAAPAPKQWWQQSLPRSRYNPYGSQQDDNSGQSANQPGQSANRPGQQPLGLLQLLMLGGKPTMSGAPSGSYGAIPSTGSGGMNWGGSSPWSWLGNMFSGGGGDGGVR